MITTNRLRLVIFICVGAVHAAVICFAVFRINTVLSEQEAEAKVMKLADIREAAPPPPPPETPPPPRPVAAPRAATPTEVVPIVAENMVASDAAPSDQVLGDPGGGGIPSQLDYLAQHQISVLPQFSEQQILRNIVYPAIALRSGIEGTVILELFIDNKGEIRRINILKESPEGRGFGDAAINAFEGLSAVPAQANGEAVAVRYRYPVRFKIRR